jgi:DNA-binding NtrC family response regulator
MVVDHPDRDRLDQPVRILAVDDEPVVRAVLREALDRPGRYVVLVDDGERAIELLLSEPFDLLIADKNLPGITGLDVIRRAKATDARMATLLVTAFASRDSAEEAMAIGIDDYLCKPFDLSDLQTKVDEALDRRHQRQAAPARRAAPAAPVRARVWICDPSAHSRELIREAVEQLGHRTHRADNLGAVIEALRRRELDALFCDLDVLERDDASACFLRSALILAPQVLFVALAGRRGVEDAIQAIHRGAGLVLYRPLESAAAVESQIAGLLSPQP